MTIKEPKVFRLRDILTKEVSLVDRAANKRSFLLRKQDAGQPVESDGKGGFVSAAPTEPGHPPPPAEPPVPKPKPPEPKDVDKSGPLEVTKAAYAGICTVIERLTALAKNVRPSETLTLDAEALTARFTEALDGVEFGAPREVPVWADGVWECNAGTLHKALKSASQKLTEVADSLAVDTTDNPPPHEVRWRIVDVLENLVEFTRFEVAQAAMAKRGEPAQFESIVKGLESVLASELESEPQRPAVDSAYAAKLVQTAEDVIKAMGARIRKQAARITALESEPQLSHRIPVGEEHEVKKQSGEVSWPLNMNQKIYTPEDDLSFA